MLEKVPGNFKMKYAEHFIQCDFCSKDMTQNHCFVCPGQKDEREGLDMNNLDDLVTYFTNILDKTSRRR